MKNSKITVDFLMEVSFLSVVHDAKDLHNFPIYKVYIDIVGAFYNSLRTCVW